MFQLPVKYSCTKARCFQDGCHKWKKWVEDTRYLMCYDDCKMAPESLSLSVSKPFDT